MTSHEDTILVIEDDRALREGLALNFELHGYQVETAADGEEGMRKAFDIRPDLIILDIMLPGWSGLDILAELRDRRRDVPVLILSARGTTDNKVEGLNIGADDYLAKPFELPELLARVEAMLRRRRVNLPSEPLVVFGHVTLDRDNRRVSVRGTEVALSAKEFDLLCFLALPPGRPRTREEILNNVWGWDFEGSPRTVDNFIRSLRRKLEPDPSHPRHILTAHGVGYKLQP
ncbi:MAG: response regulator transcription factor [Acidobacteria bacterium]|nr:response regulator transcription factor [Candidatus Sulfomarinibacter kjeldsenii]MBD3855250.1 response regulator transcription factor [Candidatus Sulfomarinibacter kjeldsenii]